MSEGVLSLVVRTARAVMERGEGMNESILTSVKKVLGIDADYAHFDADVIMHINTAMGVLTQLGVGPVDGFVIEDDKALWSELIGDGKLLHGAKTYVYLKVRMLFDPPTASAVIESMNRTINELEWRLNVATERIEINAVEIQNG